MYRGQARRSIRNVMIWFVWEFFFLSEMSVNNIRSNHDLKKAPGAPKKVKKRSRKQAWIDQLFLREEVDFRHAELETD